MIWATIIFWGFLGLVAIGSKQPASDAPAAHQGFDSVIIGTANEPSGG